MIFGNASHAKPLFTSQKLHDVLRILSSTFLSLIVASCGAEKSIEDASKSIEKSSENLRDGLNQLDPAGIKKLLDENEILRKTMEEIQGKLTAASGAVTVVVGKGSQARLEITGYLGTLRLTAWVDDPQNQFVSNIVYSAPSKPFVLSQTWSYISGSNAGTPYQVKDQILQQVAQSSFDAFVKNPFVMPSPGAATFAIDHRFVTAGAHKIFFLLTPVALDSHDQWEIEYKVYVQSGGQDSLILQGRRDSQTSSFTLGKPMPAEQIGFVTVSVQ